MQRRVSNLLILFQLFTVECTEKQAVWLNFQGKIPVKDKFIEKFKEKMKNCPDIKFSPTSIKLENGRKMTAQKKKRKIRELHFEIIPTFRIYVETRNAKRLKDYFQTEKYLTINEKKYFVIENACKICFEPTEVQNMTVLPCNQLHMLCLSCVDQMRKIGSTHCPICREKFDKILEDARRYENRLNFNKLILVLPEAARDLQWGYFINILYEGAVCILNSTTWGEVVSQWIRVIFIPGFLVIVKNTLVPEWIREGGIFWSQLIHLVILCALYRLNEFIGSKTNRKLDHGQLFIVLFGGKFWWPFGGKPYRVTNSLKLAATILTPFSVFAILKSLHTSLAVLAALGVIALFMHPALASFKWYSDMFM